MSEQEKARNWLGRYDAIQAAERVALDAGDKWAVCSMHETDQEKRTSVCREFMQAFDALREARKA